MKVTGFKTWRLEVDSAPWYFGNPIPKDEPLKWEYPLTRVSTDEDIHGYTMGYGANGEGRIDSCILHDLYVDALVGEDPFQHEAIWQVFKRKNRHLYSLTDTAIGMLDVALWDIKGKVTGLPIAALLGVCRSKIPSYRTVSYFLPTPEKVSAAARQAKEAGYRGCKFNFFDGPALDIPRLRAAREAVGPEFPLMHDGSSFYSLTDALEIGRALGDLHYHWFEEPVYDRQLGILKRLTDELDVPILAAETVTLAELPEFLRHDVVDLLRGDVLIKGGVTGLRKAFAACELFGLNLEIHTTSSPVLDVANLHVACSVHNCQFLETHHDMFRFGLKNSPLEIDSQGYLHLPAGPGLGVELDWDWIDNHTIEVIEN